MRGKTSALFKDGRLFHQSQTDTQASYRNSRWFFGPETMRTGKFVAWIW